MKCSTLKVGGYNVIVCGAKRIQACCKCGGPAVVLCDWKIDSYHTCDKPICERCTVKPAEGKDLCPRHAEAWARHPANPNSTQSA